MAFFDYLNPLVFLIAFGIGVIFVYLYKEPPKIVFKHPTPENIANTIFRNQKTGSCYKYRMTAIPCPPEEDDISDIPI